MRIEVSTQKQHNAVPKTQNTSLIKKEYTVFGKFSNKRKEAFYREFSLLLKSGVDFNKALELLITQEKNKHISSIYSTILTQVIRGKSLHESLQDLSEFSPYEVFSIKAGEEIRRLPEVLDELQKYYERKIKIKRQITSIFAYPTFVLTLTIGVLYFMLNYVVPMFSSIFKQFGGELPWITQFVIKLSARFNTIALVFVGTVAAIIIAHKLLKSSERYKLALGHAIIRIPLFGKNIKRIALMKFCQAMTLLLSAKTSLTESLELTASIVDFYPLKKTILQAKESVIKGVPLYESLDRKFFDTKIITMITIGEEVNELDTMFDKLTKQLNDEMEFATKTIGSIIEPLMIFIIAIIVGFILIAMYYPMFSLSQVIGN
ncbi:type II secretion system F family protein [Dokdonia sp.]|uniref:type II secretion system F family protein n=1 Tax=Dokdonia sp. TaxID=2024995 RepID=UPI0032663362